MKSFGKRFHGGKSWARFLLFAKGKEEVADRLRIVSSLRFKL